MIASADRIAEFRRLHESGCFVMPNPWDTGSARALAAMGFKALATTSAGFAWSTGLPDNAVDLETTLEHLRVMAAAVDLPVNADFQGGFATAPDEVAVLRFELAVDRVRAARAAIDESGTGVVLTARSEGFVWGRPDIDEAVRRLVAYAEAGADCLYAPFLTSLDEARAIVAAVAPKPVNLLINAPFATVAEAAAAGVRRISVGGMLAKTAWRGFLTAAREIAERGTFSQLTDLPDLNSLPGPR